MTEKEAAMPRIQGPALAEILEALAPRLHKRLDAAVERAGGWPRTTAAGDADGGTGGTVTFRVDEETSVTLRLTDGVVVKAEDVSCDCLLAPACLHRAAAAAVLPLDEGTATGSKSDAAATEDTRAERAASEAPGTPLTARERAAATALWESATAVLVAGLVGANLFTEAALARATHDARAVGLHRAASLGTRVGTDLRAARERRPEHRLEQLAADLRELLSVTYQLTHATEPSALSELRGQARRSYREHGGMRLHGLFTEAIVSGTGHAGVVGHLVDENGVIWSTATIAPGGPELVRSSYDSSLKLGGTTLTHRELGRSGMLLSGGASSEDRRLSGGAATKAVRTESAGWATPAISGLFDRPLADQLARALRADRDDESFGAGDDLVFLRAHVLGLDEMGLVLVLDTCDAEDAAVDAAAAEAAAVAEAPTVIHCLPPEDSPTTRHNFARVAAIKPSLKLIARPDRTRPGTVHGLAINVEGELINLGLDRIPVPKGEPQVEKDDAAQNAAQNDVAPLTRLVPADPTALHVVQHRVEQSVAAGRAVTRTALLDRDCTRLDRDALHTAAALLRDLAVKAEPAFDEFQRPIDSVQRPRDGYPLAWLAAAVYAHAATQERTVSRWLRVLS